MSRSRMSNIELLAIGKMVNSSEAMFDRRRRILREARKMISRGGLDEFNMRDLGARANVSTRTIYNAFGSKEMVVALAIHAYFETFVSHLQFSEDPTTFTGALTRQVTSTLRDVDIPHYMKALVALYFSPTVHPDIRNVLLDLASRSWLPWLRGLQVLRQIGRGVDISDLIIDLSNFQYAKLHEWCLGGLDDESFVRKSLSGILLLLIGATRGHARAHATEAFDQLQSDSEFRRQLLANARDRITAMEATDTQKAKAPEKRPLRAKPGV
jgi:AcrR family transcriptional regulator